MTGRAAHASRPHLGNNVIPAVSTFLQEMKYGVVDENNTLLNIGMVQIGDARNTVPGFASLTGEIRSISEGKIGEMKQQCEQLLSQIEKSFGIISTVTWIRENYGYQHDSPEAREFIRKTEYVLQELTLPPSHEQMGLSDANAFNQHNILCLEMGNGAENGHMRQERIKILDMEELAKLMIELVKV